MKFCSSTDPIKTDKLIIYFLCFSADWSIEALLHKWNLKYAAIPLEKFHANKDKLAGSTLPGSHTIQMMVITLKTGLM